MEWTNIKDKIPEWEQDVLVWNGKHIMLMHLSSISQYSANSTIIEFQDTEGLNTDVTHWMALPDPPPQKASKMEEIKIERYNWQPNFPKEIHITDKRDQFTITLKQGQDIEIECNWDYGYGGRGTEQMYIPLETLKNLIEEIQLTPKQ